jgi:hypothetical protein
MNKEQMIDQNIDDVAVSTGLLLLAQKLPDHPGSAIVCTEELTPSQIDLARTKGHLVVRRDGVGFALVHNKNAKVGSDISCADTKDWRNGMHAGDVLAGGY